MRLFLTKYYIGNHLETDNSLPNKIDTDQVVQLLNN